MEGKERQGFQRLVPRKNHETETARSAAHQIGGHCRHQRCCEVPFATTAEAASAPNIGGLRLEPLQQAAESQGGVGLQQARHFRLRLLLGPNGT
ncbi:hypothetical protein QG37_01344 [Candidozyma auris]|uniref:Uncharacterized protein n=1 Tax=Candidozyma auris TaxID=498019 RepID=A0A0L0P587_CANAR|nr:hypothetical protein QG37_01344 [[Candida] auris]